MRLTVFAGAALAILIFFIYFAHSVGRGRGRAECERNHAVQAVAVTQRIEIIRKQVNEKVNTSATGDIRRQLREKYTIGD